MPKASRAATASQCANATGTLSIEQGAGESRLFLKYGLPVGRAGSAYAELAILRGDPSDGLPGVAGVGEKTAAGLLARHGSLDSVLAAAADPKSDVAKGIRVKLANAADYLDAAETVVRVGSAEGDTVPSLDRVDSGRPSS